MQQQFIRRPHMDVQIRIPERSIKKEQPQIDPVHHVGDVVVHPSEGICSIESIEKMKFGTSADTLYYILKPNMPKGSSRVYLPVNRGNTLLRHLLDQSEIDQTIIESRSHPSLWIEDNKQRKEAFNLLLNEGNYVKLIRMVCDIHDHTAERIADGKKPCAADEAILEEAERLLHSEFAYVLNIPVEDVSDYIRARLFATAS